MRKLSVFNNVSLDGYIADASGDMSWAQQQDPEWNRYVADNAQADGPLLLGRVTYELMASFWPTPAAREHMPAVAERMNALPKIVFSRTLEAPAWQNTTVVRDDLVAATTALKREPGPDMVILGSGSIVSQLSEAGLIDEYEIVLVPVALGGGKTMFETLGQARRLTLESTRSFSNGNVVLRYRC